MKRLNPAIPGSRQHDSLKNLDNQSGVYALWNRKKVYVGSTKNLRSRLRAHSKIFAGWEFEYQMADIDTARYKEKIWIKKFAAAGFEVLNTYRYESAMRHPLVSRQLVYSRLKSGWSLDLACKTPPKK